MLPNAMVRGASNVQLAGDPTMSLETIGSSLYTSTLESGPFVASTPNASSSSFTIGTKQFVVHDALEITLCCSASNVSSLTPTTNVASAPADGALTITSGAPASRCSAAFSRSVNTPVDSTTTSTL